MPTIARLVGGAGTGKTTRLLELMTKTIDAGGIEPNEIGFVSFTRAARREAAERASHQFGCTLSDLENDGWFRTLHSCCYRMIGKSRTLLTDCVEDNKWMTEAMQEEVSASGSDDVYAEPFTSTTQAGVALSIWGAARNRLVSLEQAYEDAVQSGGTLPPYDYAVEVIERYEQAKRLDDRIDFTDLIAIYAGYKFNVEGAYRVQPCGYVPATPVWFLDEQQDTSALLDAVCHRLIEHSRWVYVVGDPFQSIYRFGGADSSLFMSWDVAKEEVMRKSYRCPADVLMLGEELLSQCSDYWDRKIAPADHDGCVESMPFTKDIAASLGIVPSEEWLVVARSNWHAKRLAASLDAAGIPWVPTRGGGRWVAPVRNAGLATLYCLQRGAPIDGKQWVAALKLLPSRVSGVELVKHGTKASFGKGYDPAAKWPFVFLQDMGELGATEKLIEMIASGAWANVLEKADEFTDAANRYGLDDTLNSKVRVGTIHSVKGAESDNVLWLTTTSEQVARGAESEEGYNEEQRVAYVAATRARRRLVIAKEPTRFSQHV